MKKAVSVDVWNDFYPERMDELVSRLKQGERIHIYVNCTGNTRAEMVEGIYLNELKKVFGEKLKEGKEDGWFEYYYLEE